MAFQGDSIFWVEVEKVVPNPFQPRREFDQQKLVELSESVRMYGIMQPLTVTRKEIQREDGTFYTEYELIAGERRLRASKLAGLSQVPVIIREGEESEQEKLELAIIENLQREDLSAIDRALAFKQLAEVFGLSHTQVAKKVGRSREYVSNSIRLLALPDYMQASLRQGEMTEGHARTLLMLNDRPTEQDVVFREILLKKLSVREVERIVRKIATDKVRKKHSGEFDAELIEIEKKFMETLGTRVQIQKTDFGGKLTIDYFSVDDLQGMLTLMKHDDIAKGGNILAAIAGAKLTSDTPLEVNVPIDDDGRDSAAFTDEELLSPEIEEVEVSIPTEASPQPEVATPQNFHPEAVAPRIDGFHGHHSVATPGEYTAPIEVHTPEPVSPAVPQNSYKAPEVLSRYHSMVPTAFSPIPTPVPVAPVVEPAAPAYTPVPEPSAPRIDGFHGHHSVATPGEYTAPIEVHTPEPVSPVKRDDDDSGLYSIRNFKV